MTLDPRALQIHTDGSAYRNPGHVSGCTVIARYPEHLSREDEIIFDFGCPKSTNQRMELMACIEGLKWVRRNAPWHGVSCVLLITDFQNVVRFISLAPRWKRAGWRGRSGQPIANHDLWDDLLKSRAKAGIRTEFVWQPGKKSDIAKRVDKTAKAAAQRGGIGLDRGYRPGAFGRSKVKGGVAQPYPANGQTIVVYPYAKKSMLKKSQEIRISFNVFDEPTQTFAHKCFAFGSVLMGSELHRNNAYRVRFNSETRYPQILELIEEVAIPRPRAKLKVRLGTA